MRQDFKSLLTEGHRRHKTPRKYHKRYKWLGEDHDYGPTFAKTYSYKGPWSINTQYLNRFLISRVGRPWNDIYKEICEVFDSRSKLGREFLDLVESYIPKNVGLFNGHWYSLKYGRYLADFYVDPTSKTLQHQNKRKIEKELKTARKSKGSKTILLSENQDFKNTIEYIKGFWFFVDIQKYNTYDWTKFLPDGTYIALPAKVKEEAYRKKRLNDLELKQYNLRNCNTRRILPAPVVERQKEKYINRHVQTKIKY